MTPHPSAAGVDEDHFSEAASRLKEKRRRKGVEEKRRREKGSGVVVAHYFSGNDSRPYAVAEFAPLSV